MSDNKQHDPSHDTLSEMAKADVEQPGDTPSDTQPNTSNSNDETEDAPWETD